MVVFPLPSPARSCAGPATPRSSSVRGCVSSAHPPVTQALTWKIILPEHHRGHLASEISDNIRRCLLAPVQILHIYYLHFAAHFWSYVNKTEGYQMICLQSVKSCHDSQGISGQGFTFSHWPNPQHKMGDVGICRTPN